MQKIKNKNAGIRGEACLNLCYADTTCVAVDWNRILGACRVYTSVDPVPARC